MDPCKAANQCRSAAVCPRANHSMDLLQEAVPQDDKNSRNREKLESVDRTPSTHGLESCDKRSWSLGEKVGVAQCTLHLFKQCSTTSKPWQLSKPANLGRRNNGYTPTSNRNDRSSDESADLLSHVVKVIMTLKGMPAGVETKECSHQHLQPKRTHTQSASVTSVVRHARCDCQERVESATSAECVTHSVSISKFYYELMMVLEVKYPSLQQAHTTCKDCTEDIFTKDLQTPCEEGWVWSKSPDPAVPKVKIDVDSIITENQALRPLSDEAKFKGTEQGIVYVPKVRWVIHVFKEMESGPSLSSSRLPKSRTTE
eukprot:3472521-Amphidinium_carterae.2